MSTDMLAIVNCRVVTVDAQGSIVDNATIVVDENGLIREIASGSVAHTATTVIDARGGIVMPGLVNAHAHLGMTLFRGLGDDMNLEDFLARLMPAEISILNHDAVVAGTELGALESLLGGITTTLDMYYLPDAAQEVAARSGARIFSAPNLLESEGPEPLPFDARMEWSDEWLTAAHAAGNDTLNWLAPHSTYLLGEDHLLRIAALAEKHGAHIHVHASETVGEMKLVANRHNGRTPIQVLAPTALPAIKNWLVVRHEFLICTKLESMLHLAPMVQLQVTTWTYGSRCASLVTHRKTPPTIQRCCQPSTCCAWQRSMAQKHSMSTTSLVLSRLVRLPTSSCLMWTRHHLLLCLTRMWQSLPLPVEAMCLPLWSMAESSCMKSAHSRLITRVPCNECANWAARSWLQSKKWNAPDASNVALWPLLQLIG